ncbi:hypothetical protein C8R45DRAFT_1181389 [Mycena sanguinolenta]|nr:hypothetical protein C8R45DRAFT_1181389 [Mycena sanguinolenta]
MYQPAYGNVLATMLLIVSRLVTSLTVVRQAGKYHFGCQIGERKITIVTSTATYSPRLLNLVGNFIAASISRSIAFNFGVPRQHALEMYWANAVLGSGYTGSPLSAAYLDEVLRRQEAPCAAHHIGGSETWANGIAVLLDEFTPMLNQPYACGLVDSEQGEEGIERRDILFCWLSFDVSCAAINDHPCPLLPLVHCVFVQEFRHRNHLGQGSHEETAAQARRNKNVRACKNEKVVPLFLRQHRPIDRHIPTNAAWRFLWENDTIVADEEKAASKDAVLQRGETGGVLPICEIIKRVKPIAGPPAGKSLQDVNGSLNRPWITLPQTGDPQQKKTRTRAWNKRKQENDGAHSEQECLMAAITVHSHASLLSSSRHGGLVRLGYFEQRYDDEQKALSNSAEDGPGL